MKQRVCVCVQQMTQVIMLLIVLCFDNTTITQ